MKLVKIEIENFSSYYGKHQIDLNTNEKKPLIIFIGGTGYGKTSLFDAINWSLYGEDYEKDLLSKKNRPITDYVHEVALNEAYRKKVRAQMSVTLFFEHSEDGAAVHEYYINQTISVKPKKVSVEQDGKKVEKIEGELADRSNHLRRIRHSGDHEEIPYTKTFLDEVLPNNVKSYFLFDGDRIHNLAKPGNSQEVQEAIYRVVDLEIIRNATEHLSDAAEEYSKKAAKAAKGELAKVESSYNEEFENQKKIKARISVIRKERQAIKDQVERIEAKLKELPETKALQEHKIQLKKDLEKNDQRQRETKNRIREYGARAAYSIILGDIKDLGDLLHDKRAKGEIPKHIRETFFKDLFKLGECICGTKFKKEKSDKVYDTLKKRSEQEKDWSHEEDQLIDLYHQLSQAESLIHSAKQTIAENDDLLIELEKEEKALIYQLQEVEKQLGELPLEDVNILLEQRKEREGRDKDLYAELLTKQTQLSTSEDNLKRLDADRKELGKRQDEAQALHLRSGLAKEAADKLNELYDAFAEKSRQDVERLTIEEFKSFVISSSEYRVALSSEYSLEVLDSNGNRALQRLSMGQSQCLSLAFITAISRVSKKNPPLVIDMPFGRLDPDVHEAVSMRLPSLSTQSILFLIPVIEWNDTTRKNLSKYAKHIYEMSFDKANKQTSIVSIN